MNMMITQQQLQELVGAAMAARQLAYAPYSDQSVGAAVLTAEGQIYTGCNIENAAFAPSLCAERVALAKAISSGERRLVAIAICGGPVGTPVGEEGLFYPCGICRQMLAEFASGEMIVICASDEQHYQQITLAELLPYPYPPDSLTTN